MNPSEETLRFIRLHRRDDVRALALQAAKYPDVDMAEAVVQIAGIQIAEKKIPQWAQTEGILYPKHLSMEQCSSEVTARYKASLVEGDSFADLTAGFGVDCSFIARRFRRAEPRQRSPQPPDQWHSGISPWGKEAFPDASHCQSCAPHSYPGGK